MKTHTNLALRGIRFIESPEDQGGDAPNEDKSQDESKTPETPGRADENDPADEDFDASRALDKIRKLNSENRNLREAKKAAEDKAAGLDEKETRIKELEAENLRIRVGARLGLPDELVDRLKGSTEEEILADAEKLVALVAPKRTAPTRQPKTALRGGVDPDVEPEEKDPRKLAALIPRR